MREEAEPSKENQLSGNPNHHLAMLRATIFARALLRSNHVI
jgi:hypothetical protein